MAEVAVVQTPSLQCFQSVGGKETPACLQVNFCFGWSQDSERVQRIEAHNKYSNSSGMYLEGIQDGVMWYV